MHFVSFMSNIENYIWIGKLKLSSIDVEEKEIAFYVFNWFDLFKWKELCSQVRDRNSELRLNDHFEFLEEFGAQC